MKKEKSEKLKPGTELIYTDGNTLMEKLTVESINKEKGYALLTNKVKVSREIDKFGKYNRTDGKGIQYALPLNEENLKVYESYIAYQGIRILMGEIEKGVRNLTKESELVIPVYKRLIKVTKMLKGEKE